MRKIQITIEDWDDKRLPSTERFLGYISDGEYKGCVSTGESIQDVLKEIGISILVKDQYEESIKIKKD